MSEAEREFALRLDTRVDELGERLAKIEGGMGTKPAKGLGQNAATFLSAVAFFLSLFLSAYTAYDKVITEPREERQEQETDLRDDINTLADLAGRIAELDGIAPQAARVQMDLLTPQRSALHKRILEAESELPGALGFADYLLLARDLESAESYEQALAQNIKAHALATKPVETANAYWSQARIEGGLKQLDAMRMTFANTIGEFESLGTKRSASIVLQVYLDWVSLELIHGNCDTAGPIHSSMLALYHGPEVQQSTRLNFYLQHSLMLSRTESQCSLLLELPSIQNLLDNLQ